MNINPVDINPRQLQAFVLAYRLGSITKAAARMHVTQSAVSVLLRQLEARLGVLLFDRTTRALRPTAAAEEALPRAERVLRDLEHLGTSLRGLAEKTRGEIGFAASATVASALLPPILAEFQAQHPRVKLAMQDVGPRELVPKVIDEEVEFAIGTVDRRTPEITLSPLLSDDLSAICQRSSPLAVRKQVAWDEIVGLSTITAPKGSDIRILIDEALALRGKSFEPRYEVSYLTTALSMTAHGLGIAIMPAHLVAHLQYPTLVARKLVDPAIKRELSIVTKKGRSLSPAAESFIATARRIVARDDAAPEAEVAPLAL